MLQLCPSGMRFLHTVQAEDAHFAWEMYLWGADVIATGMTRSSSLMRGLKADTYSTASYRKRNALVNTEDMDDF